MCCFSIYLLVTSIRLIISNFAITNNRLDVIGTIVFIEEKRHYDNENNRTTSTYDARVSYTVGKTNYSEIISLNSSDIIYFSQDSEISLECQADSPSNVRYSGHSSASSVLFVVGAILIFIFSIFMLSNAFSGASPFSSTPDDPIAAARSAAASKMAGVKSSTIYWN